MSLTHQSLRNEEQPVNHAIELIEQLTRDRFYGAVTIKFEAGRVVLMRKEETLKPNNLSEHPRSEYAEPSKSR